MRTILTVRTYPWAKELVCAYKGDASDFNVGDKVVLETEFGTQIATIEVLQAMADELISTHIAYIERGASEEDTRLSESLNTNTQHYVESAQKKAKEYELEMKMVTAVFSLDGYHLTITFIAPQRVDFRDLVRELTATFKKSIRFHQIGVRDEAKLNPAAQLGTCGQELCCRRFLKTLGNVNADMAKTQDVMHRGADRLTGQCGRLKCCLRYEQDVYEQLSTTMPAIGGIMETKHGKGEIVNWHVLRQTVDVRIAETGAVMEVPFKK